MGSPAITTWQPKKQFLITQPSMWLILLIECIFNVVGIQDKTLNVKQIFLAEVKFVRQISYPL
jgi:hypothetical protein